MGSLSFANASAVAASSGISALTSLEPFAILREETYSMEMNIIENFKRVYYFTKRMCRVLIPSAGKRSEVD